MSDYDQDSLLRRKDASYEGDGDMNEFLDDEDEQMDSR